MEKLILKVKTREVVGKKVKKLREQGELPVVLYGHDVMPKIFSINLKEFNHIYNIAGRSSLVELEVNDTKETINVLIHQVDFNPKSDIAVHADLLQVKLTEKVKAEIPIILEGQADAPVVKEKEGSIILNRDHVEVEAFPQDLIHEIKLDVSQINEFDHVIHVRDINVTDRIDVLDDPNEVVVSVQEPRSEEELAKLEQEVVEDVESVEVEKKGKEEDAGEESEVASDDSAKVEDSGKKE